MPMEKTINYKKSGIYIIQFDNGIKIGISKNINSRMHGVYRSPWVREIKQVKVYAHNNPRHLEQAVINRFKSNIVNNSKEFITGVEFDEVCSYIRSVFHITNNSNKDSGKYTRYDKKLDKKLEKRKPLDEVFELLYKKHDYK